uniref:Protein FAR1-RELATED SEQUENCE n=1 Tax=Ananas comosus var. bracteatus TaxID=296719 RepID=A0A6V7NP18_ANACO|nr:unnamed protein product [Ananas comosus var. bracteatus]
MEHGSIIDSSVSMCNLDVRDEVNEEIEEIVANDQISNISKYPDDELYVGLEFTCIEDGKKFYNDYAFKMGFSIRKQTHYKARKHDDAITSMTYCCSKAGRSKTASQDKSEHQKSQDSHTPKKDCPNRRTNCKAHIVLKVDDRGKDETADTFCWLFETWMKAMYGKNPKAIITDQDPAMKKAIEIVFPTTIHSVHGDYQAVHAHPAGAPELHAGVGRPARPRLPPPRRLLLPGLPQTPAAERIRAMKSSLPRALSRFYPLAGELVLNTHVRCCDAGARFLEARADADLADFLRGLRGLHHVEKLLPCARSCSAAGAEGAPLLSVQATAFRCGGLALGVCACHKILDGRSLFLFLQSWASAAPDPVFDGAALFPPSQDVVPEEDQARPPARGRSPCARCCGAARCARALRPRGPRWRRSWSTRARAWRPPPDASFGNRCFSAGAAAAKATVELVLARSGAARGVLEEELGRSAKMMNADHTRKLRAPDGHSSAYALIVDGVIRSRGFEGFDHYFFSSWLSLPLYEVDFGWGGRPGWDHRAGSKPVGAHAAVAGGGPERRGSVGDDGGERDGRVRERRGAPPVRGSFRVVTPPPGGA